jgi:hypothetical protein
MAVQPTIYIVASDQHRNGKTLLARLLVDYLMIDGRDPFVFDTDAPDGPLRSFFPGRTALADFAAITGQMKLFDTILVGTGRDYVVDLPARHTESFFAAERDLAFFAECKRLGFRVFLFFIVDQSFVSMKAAKALQHYPNVDLFVPVRNMSVRSSWPEDDGALTIPYLSAPIASAVGHKRFSFRAFVQGDNQALPEDAAPPLRNFLYDVFNNLSNLEPVYSLNALKNERH